MFVLEQHLGHRTYAANLAAAPDLAEFDVRWVDVEYGRRSAGWHNWPRVARVAGALAGRRQVRTSLRQPADVLIRNPQVPAALAGGALREPYVVITDVTPLQYAARSIVEDYGVGETRVVVVPPGDTTKWKPREPPAGAHDGVVVRLLFVGGECERKGGDLVLDVMADLPRHVELTIVIQAKVPARRGVTVMSDMTSNDPRLIELYRSADLFVLPTRAETFGIAAAETQSVGIPVVSPRIAGLTDIVEDEVTGPLIDAGDAGALSDALQRLVADPALRSSWGATARRRAVERFDSRTKAGRLFGLVRTCVQ